MARANSGRSVGGTRSAGAIGVRRQERIRPEAQERRAVDGEPQKIDADGCAVHLDVIRALLGHSRDLQAERSAEHERTDEAARLLPPPPLVRAGVDGKAEAPAHEPAARAA